MRRFGAKHHTSYLGFRSKASNTFLAIPGHAMCWNRPTIVAWLEFNNWLIHRVEPRCQALVCKHGFISSMINFHRIILWYLWRHWLRLRGYVIAVQILSSGVCLKIFRYCDAFSLTEWGTIPLSLSPARHRALVRGFQSLLHVSLLHLHALCFR